MLIIAILACDAVSATNHTVNPGDNIQDVVNGANDGDNITVNTGTYNENVNVTKNLTIKANGTVTINASSTGSCFHIYSGGSGSTIQGFILTDATQSSTAGVYLGTDANNCNILQNTMLNNWAGMWIWSSYNQIYDNNISDNYNHGIRLVSSSGNNNIYSNIIKNNNLNNAYNGGGITSSTAPDENNNLYLNQIVGNTRLQIDWNTQNPLYADNNWWGTNAGPSGIEGNIVYTNWLVLGITADPYSINNGQTSTITADLNHNFNGTTYTDISSLGHVKDGIPISFIFTGSPLGTLSINPVNTLNGNATTIFTANSVGTSHINATLDSANVHTASNAAQTPCDIVIAPSTAHVTLTKTATTTTPNYWDLVTFTITAHNNGPSNAEGVQVTDILPAGLTYIDSTPSGTTTYNPTTGIWNIGTLNNGADTTLNITANMTATGIFTNWANVTAQTTPDNQPFNTTSITLNIPEASIIEMTKEFRATLDGPAITTANYLDTIYTIFTYENKGPDYVKITVTDTPSGFTIGNEYWVGFSPDTTTWTHQNSKFTGTNVWFGQGSKVWFGLIGTVNQTGLINNTANVTSQDTYHPGPLASATAQINVPTAAVIEMTKEFRATLDGPAITTANYLDTIYTIFTYENKGPDATNVQVIDNPSGFTLGDEYWIGYSPDPTTWFHVNSKFTNAYTFISPGDKVWIGLIGTVNQTGLINNTANVTSQDTYHPGPLASATAQINVPTAAVIEMTKEFRATLDGPAITTANYLDTIYTIFTCENKGPDATTIRVTDTPSGFTIGNEYWVGFSPDTTTWTHYNSPFSQQYIGFGQGTKVWIGMIGTVTKTGPINNTANVTEQDTYHPGPLASATAQINVPDITHITLTKTANTTTPNYWDLVTFTITAHNNGPSNAEGVQVTDILPAGLTYIDSTPSGTTTYNPTTGIWNIGTLNNGADTTLNITATMTATGIFTNWANVTAQTTPDNQPFNTTSITLNIPEAAALELTKSVNNNSPKVHDTIIYTLIVQNHGPNAATYVNVAEVLPLGGLNFVGVDSVDYGSYNNGVWSIPNLPANTIAHLVLRFTVESSGAIENQATLTSLTWDPELYPHSSIVTINAQDPSADQNTTVNAQNSEKTVSMQETGLPLSAALLALVMLVNGILYSKKE